MPVTLNDALLGHYGRSIALQDVRFIDPAIVRPTIITWQRLEPLPRTEDLSVALRAEIADPLWLLVASGSSRSSSAKTPGRPSRSSSWAKARP